MRKTLGVTFALAPALMLVALKVRKDIPNQEVFPLDGAVASITSGGWQAGKLKLTLESSDGRRRLGRYDQDGTYQFGELQNGREYGLKIERTDFLGRVRYRPHRTRIIPRIGGTRYIVVIGASIADRWRVHELDRREGLGAEALLGRRIVYGFDKTEDVERLSRLPFRVEAVILKECSAFFPRELEPSYVKLGIWIEQLRRAGIRPVLTTVIPVTRQHDQRSPGRLRDLLAFNRYLREYARNEGVELLDLEVALGQGVTEPFLKEEYAAPDGLHLSDQAYRDVLDPLLARWITSTGEGM